MRFGSAVILATVAFFGLPLPGDASFSPRSALGATSIDLSLADLVAKSTVVLAGTPLESKSIWQEDGGARSRRIVTYTRVRVDRVIDGSAGGEVWVRTLGGEVGDIGQQVAGEAVLVPAQPTLLFLRTANDGTHGVVGMGQGQFALEVSKEGAPVRVLAPRAVGHLVPKAAAPSAEPAPARLVLPGRTLDEASQLIAAERRAHAR